MHWVSAVFLMFGGVLGFMALGVPVAFGFLLIDLVGVFLFMGGQAGLKQFVNNSFSSVSAYTLAPIPMFLLMGELFFHTGLAVRVFDAVDKLLGRVPARLSLTTVAGGTLFAALSGSSMGNTALLGSLMVPEMTRRGYKPVLSVGPIMGTGSLAILIPPSAMAVLLGSIALIDIGKLLLAGIIPGLMLSMLYVALILLIAKIDPKAAPGFEVTHVPLSVKLRAVVVDILPMAFIIFLVIGSMLLGWATPTEAAALGAGGVLILAALMRCLSIDGLLKATIGTLKVTVMALFIVLGSITFSQIVAFSGASSGLIGWATSFELSPLAMLLTMFLILLVLGCFMEQIAMMMLAVPIFFPLAATLGFDPIWFGVIVMMAMEIGYTTPPFGLLLFIMRGLAPAGMQMVDIYLAAAPYLACALIVVALLVAFPSLVTFLN